jgi:hypothetical protein
MHWDIMMTQPDPFDLEAAFARARSQPPQMSQDLSTRIARDAQAHLPAPPLWRRVAAAVGGLVTATVAGFWLGVAPPSEAVDPLRMIVAQEDDMSDLFGFEWISEEG